MEQLYNKLTIKSFKLISSLCLVAADLGILFYLYFKFTDIKVFKASMKIVKLALPGASSQVGTDFEQQLYQLLVNTLLTMLTFFFISHVVVYLLWFREKKLAHRYVAFYTIVAAPGSLLVAATTIFSHFWQGLFWLILGGLYGFVFLGLKRFNPETQTKRS